MLLAFLLYYAERITIIQPWIYNLSKVSAFWLFHHHSWYINKKKMVWLIPSWTWESQQGVQLYCIGIKMWYMVNFLLYTMLYNLQNSYIWPCNIPTKGVDITEPFTMITKLNNLLCTLFKGLLCNMCYNWLNFFLLYDLLYSQKCLIACCVTNVTSDWIISYITCFISCDVDIVNMYTTF